MKNNGSFLTCFLVILSMTALNVVLQMFYCEKTFNIVAASLTGLVTVFLLSVQADAIYRQYTDAKIIANRRYTLIKLIKESDGQGKLEITGAILGFWDHSEKKQFFFFKNVIFSPKTDFDKHKRFVGLQKNNSVILTPLE